MPFWTTVRDTVPPPCPRHDGNKDWLKLGDKAWCIKCLEKKLAILFRLLGVYGR